MKRMRGTGGGKGNRRVEMVEGEAAGEGKGLVAVFKKVFPGLHISPIHN